MKENINKKYAIVTGGSSGVGKEFVRQLAVIGYNIVLVSNNPEGNLNVVAEVKSNCDVEIIPINLDLSLSSSVDRLVEFVDERALEVEVLICNAGMLVFGGVVATPSQRLEQIVNLHCVIPTLLCCAFGAQMSKRKKGYILIMSSMSVWMPFPAIAAYSATKSYLRSFGQSLYYELRHQGVKVTVVMPGAIDTQFYKLAASTRSKLLRFGLMQSPAEVARKSLKALWKGKRRIIIGLFAKICVAFCFLLPSCALLPVLSIKKVRQLFE